MAADSSSGVLRIAKLNNQNYQIWKFKVELLLAKEDLWQTTMEDPPNPATAAWVTKDRKARANIGLLLEDNQLHLVRKETTAKGMWNALRRYHEKSTLSNKVTLLRKLCGLKLREGGNMETHLSQMQDLIDQLSALGETLAEQLTVALFLSSLPESYGTLITALETRPEDDLTIDLVKNKLMEEYMRRNPSNTSDEFDQKALKAAEGATGGKRPITGTVKSTSHITCYFCHKPNHMKKDCRKYLEWKKKHPDHKAKTVNVVNNCDDDNDDTELDLCFRACQYTTTNAWCIDSGATSHMCSDKDFFVKLTERRGQIVLANGMKLPTAGIGEGYVSCLNDDGEMHTVRITDVLYVPQLKGNLLSVRKLTEKDFAVKFQCDGCKIFKNDVCVAYGTEKHGLYELSVTDAALSVKHCVEKLCVHAWHQRFGHRDHEAIKRLERQVPDFNIKPCSKPVSLCECCVQAKMTMKPFPKSSHSRSEAPLDLVHSDVCGPMQTTTPSGNRYFMTMIDDHSRYTKVYLLKNKSEVPQRIKEYVKYAQTKFQKNVKVFRSDCGGEYTSDDLRKFFKNEGIQVERSVPYAPQQNGCAERKNRYLVEMTRSMLIDSNLPNKYWGEALITANHMQNILPTGSEHDMTPYEKWTGKKPDPHYIRRFGCVAYATVPAKRRQKLDDKARKLTFVGYEEGMKGYRLLDRSNDRVHISRSVTFLEGDPHADDNSVSSHDDADVDMDGEPKVQQNDDHQIERRDEVSEPRRSQRINKGQAPERLIEVTNKVNYVAPEPKSFAEAQNSNEAEQWKKAMDEEIDSLQRNNTWTLTQLPEGQTVIGCKWVYKTKSGDDGQVVRYKARLVAQGYLQKYGDNYDEVFAPVASATTLRTLLTVAGHHKMIVKHYDIQAAFLNGELTHEVYMRQPDGYHEEGDDLVCKLSKSLYGLKQGANEWNKKLHHILTANDFKRSENDPCLYSKCQGGQWMYVSIHVDDMVVATTSDSMIRTFDRQMNEVIVMKDLGNLQCYLGIQIERDDDGVFLLHQRNYIEKKLKEFQLSDSRPSSVPMDPGYQKRSEVHESMTNTDVYQRAIGSLLYLSTNTRPDIAVATSILARRVSNPAVADWTEVKRIFRYLNHTKDRKLKLGNAAEQTEQLVGYVDADWGGDTDDRKSNTGYLYKYLGAPITWSSKKQALVR